MSYLCYLYTKGVDFVLTDKLITVLSSYFLTRGWIDTEDIPSCRYMLDRLIGRITFLILLAFVCAIFHCCEEAISFSVVLSIFRRRMGGWHANSRWLCQILSISSVIITSCLLGPILANTSSWTIIITNLLAILLSLFLSPVYPIQMHISPEERSGNIKRKNLFLLILSALQFPLVQLFGLRILTSVSLGLYFGIVSLFAEKIKLNRKDNHHEKTGQICQKSH